MPCSGMVERKAPIPTALAFLTHPVVVEACWLSYWSRWQVGWIIGSFVLLVGISGALYAWARYKKRDIVLILGSERQFMLLWHLIAVGILWGAVTEPLLYLWLSFFLWMSLWGLVWRLWREYSFHVYGWAGFLGFYTGYVRHYPISVLLLLGMVVGVAYLRYWQKAHSLPELWRGGLGGFVAGLGYVGFHTLMG